MVRMKINYYSRILILSSSTIQRRCCNDLEEIGISCSGKIFVQYSDRIDAGLIQHSRYHNRDILIKLKLHADFSG